MSGIIAVSAVVAMAECFIGLSNGTARIWMSMSRDGCCQNVSQSTSKYKTTLMQL
jgi:amino acid transporter